MISPEFDEGEMLKHSILLELGFTASRRIVVNAAGRPNPAEGAIGLAVFPSKNRMSSGEKSSRWVVS